jgi:hypothetical protein
LNGERASFSANVAMSSRSKAAGTTPGDAQTTAASRMAAIPGRRGWRVGSLGVSISKKF